MIEQIYESWELVTIASAVIGLITVVVGFGKFLYKWDKLNKVVRTLCTFVLVALSALIICTGFVRYQFTKVPDVCGVTVRDAKEKIHNAGLTLAMEPGVNYDENMNSEVKGQSVNADTVVPRGTSVTVYIQSKPVGSPDILDNEGKISVPNVVGMEQIAATELLAEKGLQFQVWWTEENNTEAEQYYIISQSIPADSAVPVGTLVKLELASQEP